MFADVSGFTKMSERLDPEDVRAIMNACFRGLAEAIVAVDGHVDKYVGDCVMALFGAPIAHDNDPARACHAALGMQRFLRRFAADNAARTSVPLKMRVGLNCGVVVAGTVGDTNQGKGYTVMGDAVNTASRLEHAAPVGGILVSAEVARRARGQFDFGPPRHIKVKGKAEPLEVRELVGEAGRTGRAAREWDAIFVGRHDELRILGEAICGGSKRWIAVAGEAGIGKSRLIEEVIERCGGQRPVYVMANHATRSEPLGLVRLVIDAILRMLLGNENRGDVDREDFVGMLSVLGEETVTYAQALWSLWAPRARGVQPSDIDPKTRRQMIVRGLFAMLDGLARLDPDTVLVLDALDRADRASAGIFESYGTSDRRSGLRIVVGQRTATPPARALELGPLSPAEAFELLNAMAPDAGLDLETCEQIVRRAAGVPLHVEELVGGLVHERALVRDMESGVWTAHQHAPSVGLPDSIRGAMAARRDRLPRPLRHLVSQCAVLGEEFDERALAELRRTLGMSGSESALMRGLAVRGILAPVHGRALRWRFRQPLFCETAYEMLLRTLRRDMHSAAADALLQFAQDSDDAAPARLAIHYERAERWPEAVEAHYRAGMEAVDLFVNRSALVWFGRVARAAAHIDSLDDVTREITVQALGISARVNMRIGDHAAAERLALEMRAAAGRKVDEAESIRLLAFTYNRMGRVAEAEVLFREAVALAETVPDDATETLTRGYCSLAYLLTFDGRPDEAVDQMARCRAVAGDREPIIQVHMDSLEGTIARNAGHLDNAMVFFARALSGGEKVGCLEEQADAARNMGNVMRDQGDYTAAEGHFAHAYELWERIGDTGNMAGLAVNLANLAMSRGEFGVARKQYEYSLAACEQTGEVRGLCLAHVNLALLSLEEDLADTAVVSARAALQTLGVDGHELLRARVRVVLGEALLAAGQLTEAGDEFEGVDDDNDTAAHPHAAAGAWRGLAGVALKNGQAEAACGLFRKSLAAYERLDWSQEAARTRWQLAIALRRMGDGRTALAELAHAKKMFTSLGAALDVKRVEEIRRRWEAAPDLSGSHWLPAAKKIAEAEVDPDADNEADVGRETGLQAS